MRLQVVTGSARCPGHPLSCLLIDDRVAVDAGALGWFAPPETQALIQHVLLTHSHIDHTAGLPIFLDNVYGLSAEIPTVYGTDATLDVLQSHVFNNHVMPDFVDLSKTMAPFLRLHPIAVGVPFAFDHYTVTAFAVDHTVPTVAYLIDDGHVAVAIVTDTAPVPELLMQLMKRPRLKAVCLEVSFPNSQAALAAITKHHTTQQFLDAIAMVPANVSVFAIHIKSRYYTEVCREIQAANRPNVRIAEPGLVLELN